MPFDGVATPFTNLAKFDEVIDLLETPNRWVKHTYRNRDDQYCLLGALNTVGVTKLFERVILRSISEMVEDKEFCCIESFNDHPETLHQDVVAVLYRARRHVAGAAFDVSVPPAAKLFPYKTD
jgi:hypothetical protein